MLVLAFLYIVFSLPLIFFQQTHPHIMSMQSSTSNYGITVGVFLLQRFMAAFSLTMGSAHAPTPVWLLFYSVAFKAYCLAPLWALFLFCRLSPSLSSPATIDSLPSPCLSPFPPSHWLPLPASLLPISCTCLLPPCYPSFSSLPPSLIQQPLLRSILSRSTEAFHPLYSSLHDQFELCLSKCRTSSLVSSQLPKQYPLKQGQHNTP